MLQRLRAHITKELLLLLRDRAGLALLFLMPLALVMIMAVVQVPTPRRPITAWAAGKAPAVVAAADSNFLDVGEK